MLIYIQWRTEPSCRWGLSSTFISLEEMAIFVQSLVHCLLLVVQKIVIPDHYRVQTHVYHPAMFFKACHVRIHLYLDNKIPVVVDTLVLLLMACTLAFFVAVSQAFVWRCRTMHGVLVVAFSCCIAMKIY